MSRWILFLLATLFPSLAPGFHYNGPAYSVKTYKSIEVTAGELSKEYDLRLLNISVGDLADSIHSAWGISFTSNKMMSLEDVRPLITVMITKLVRKIYQDPIFLESYKIETFRKRPLGPDSVAFKLAFWDENVDRPLSPYLAQVRYADGQVYYYYADPKTQALSLPPTIESLESLGITLEQYLNSPSP